MPRGRSLPLFWRVFLLDAGLLVVVALLLLLSPVTISAPIADHEAVTVIIGTLALLTLNAIVLRRAIRPLQRLVDRMDVVDLLRPGQRLEIERSDEIGRVVQAFNRMLDRLEAERQHSGRRLLQAQENERIAIARDLHDEVGQLLTGVLLELDAARRITDAPTLEPASASARRALEEVRRISQALRPQLLEQLGLVSALSELCTNFERTTAVRVERRFDAGDLHLSRDAELVVYRIAQESLTNIARHARATHAWLTLQRADAGGVLLEILDDGVGIQPGDEQLGGLRGMRERALLVDAHLTVEPGGAGGTRVRLVLPLAIDAGATS